MRRAGVLLHITSLPSHGPIGDLGPAAHRFVDWLADAGCTSWQILPLNPVGPAGCPYASPSAFASEPALLSLDRLVERGLLSVQEVDSAQLPPATDSFDLSAVSQKKQPLLNLAADRLAERDPQALQAYLARWPWVRDWALHRAASVEQGPCWWSWPEALRDRDAQALEALQARQAEAFNRAVALQLLFDQQWAALRAHADSRGVQLIGDVPIFVSSDSCDTWASPQLFQLDPTGRPTLRTGVPPDYFSPTGQLWGNPHYDWEAHQATGFSWWKGRLERVLHHVHRVRVDHFRGFDAAWAVDEGAETAMEGRWLPGPGKALFDALGPMPLLAEDLGIITPEVEALRDAIGAPGMKVLQFAFGGEADHPFLPHNYQGTRWAAYTGTHDNDTVRGWYDGAPDKVKHRLRVYAACDGSDVSWDLIRMAWASVADDAIAPMQDLLSLGNSARMNVPGLVDGNWSWRLEHTPEWVSGRLRGLCETFGRLPTTTKGAQDGEG